MTSGWRIWVGSKGILPMTGHGIFACGACDWFDMCQRDRCPCVAFDSECKIDVVLLKLRWRAKLELQNASGLHFSTECKYGWLMGAYLYKSFDHIDSFKSTYECPYLFASQKNCLYIENCKFWVCFRLPKIQKVHIATDNDRSRSYFEYFRPLHYNFCLLCSVLRITTIPTWFLTMEPVYLLLRK